MTKTKEDKCDTCKHAWTDRCPRKECWENRYQFYKREYNRKFENRRAKH